MNKLDYIHSQFQFYYKSIDCANILLYRFGYTKIDELSINNYILILIATANVAQYVLNTKKLTKDLKRENVKCINFIIVKLIKTKTSIFYLKFIKLKTLKA